MNWCDSVIDIDKLKQIWSVIHKLMISFQAELDYVRRHTDFNEWDIEEWFSEFKEV